ncbi:MAG: DMT family transporter [Beijerinckiaceae bacterium]
MSASQDNTKPATGKGAAASGETWYRSPVLALVVTMFFWATTTIIVRYAHGEVPPFALAFWRNAVGFLLILPFAYSAVRREWPVIRANLPLLCLLAALLWVGGNALLFLALQYTIAINAAVINSVEPVFIVAAAALLFRDRISRLQGLGIVLSMLGVLVLLTKGTFARLFELNFNTGDLIVTCAYIFWSLYAVLLRKLPRDLDPRAMLLTIVGLGALFLFPIYMAETILVRAMPVTAMSVGMVLFLAAFSCAAGMFLWNYAIGRMGAIRAGQFLHLIPAFTVLLALAMLGEHLAGYHFAGIALIAAGIAATSRG